jgi:hypothetical protein
MPLLWRQLPVHQVAWIVLAQRRRGRAQQVLERDRAAAGRGHRGRRSGFGHLCSVRTGGHYDGRQKANQLDGPGLKPHPPVRNLGAHIGPASVEVIIGRVHQYHHRHPNW